MILYLELNYVINYHLKAFCSKLCIVKSVFPDQEFLGWYSAGSGLPEKGDSYVHQTLAKYNENPLYFVLDIEQSKEAKALPISAYMLEVRFVDDQAISEFTSVGYKILSNESERITIDHIATDLTASGEKTGPSCNLFVSFEAIN